MMSPAKKRVTRGAAISFFFSMAAPAAVSCKIVDVVMASLPSLGRWSCLGCAPRYNEIVVVRGGGGAAVCRASCRCARGGALLHRCLSAVLAVIRCVRDGVPLNHDTGGSMVRALVRLEYFERHAALGAPILRLFIAFVLIYGTQDNVFSWERMIEFR